MLAPTSRPERRERAVRLVDHGLEAASPGASDHDPKSPELFVCASGAQRLNTKRPEAEYLRYAGVGLQFALTFLLFGALGWWLDGKLGTAPWLMIAGIGLGAAGAFYSLVRRLAPRPPSDSPRP